MKSKIISGKAEPIGLFRRDGSARTAGAITKAKGGYAIADTSTTAKKGDIYRAETATTALMVGKEYKVIDASANSFTIASKDLPVLGDTFYILGKTTPRLDSTGGLIATIDASPLTATSYVNTGTVTTVAYSGSSAQMLAANSSRKGLKLNNASNGDAYIKFGTTASTSSYTILLPSTGYYNMEVPYYTGRIDVIFANGSSGNLVITELTTV